MAATAPDFKNNVSSVSASQQKGPPLVIVGSVPRSRARRSFLPVLSNLYFALVTFIPLDIKKKVVGTISTLANLRLCASDSQ